MLACRARLDAMRREIGGESEKARVAACWTGAAGADQISLPTPSSERHSRWPSGWPRLANSQIRRLCAPAPGSR
ncbi:MAG TPA: hypothetical protein VK594_24790 [Streptosporangiaceae bacterium]|nr:hypothetical protein [Streptosporangiaceae bacterium]